MIARKITLPYYYISSPEYSAWHVVIILMCRTNKLINIFYMDEIKVMKIGENNYNPTIWLSDWCLNVSMTKQIRR